jgi:hypothetical protein
MSREADYFLPNDIAPRLYAPAPQRVKTYGAEDADELCQVEITMAAQMVDRLEQSGKNVTAGNVALRP